MAQAERMMAISERLTACIAGPRNPPWVVHMLDNIFRAKVLTFACGYLDADDLIVLRDASGGSAWLRANYRRLLQCR
jgi:hypothetical protein